MLFFNPYKQYLIFNLVIIILYVFQLSNLYHPTLSFCFYYLSILFFFFLLSLKHNGSTRCCLNFWKTIIEVRDPAFYDCVMVCLFLIGISANVYQIIKYGFPLLLENKVDRIHGDHYVQYLVNLLTMSSMMAYVGMREKILRRYGLYFFILVMSVFNLVIWLNRGAFSLIVLIIIYYEYIKAMTGGKLKNFYFKLILYSSLFLLFFGYIGDLRVEYVMENIFKHTINEHYGMDENYPSWFVWIYIYITSPLENIRRILVDQSPHEYTLGLKMVYPFVAPLFKMIFAQNRGLYPPLDEEAGLNVSSYMESAIMDFDLAGPYVYMIYLFIVLRIGQISLRKGVYGLLCYVSAINMSLWMVFVNSLAIGPFMISYLFFLALAWRKDVKIR